MLAVSVHVCVLLAHAPASHSTADHVSDEFAHGQQTARQSVSAFAQGAPVVPAPVIAGLPLHPATASRVVGGGAGQNVALAVSVQACSAVVQAPPLHSAAAHWWPLPSPQGQQAGAQSVLALAQDDPVVPVPVRAGTVGQPSAGLWSVAVVVEGGGQRVAVSVSAQAFEPPAQAPPAHSAAAQALPSPFGQVQQTGAQSTSASRQASPDWPEPVIFAEGTGQPAATWSVAVVGVAGVTLTLQPAVSQAAARTGVSLFMTFSSTQAARLGKHTLPWPAKRVQGSRGP